jgi:glycosyltransferase involved in cell wall biosynthesis
MKKILQINITANWGSHGRIAEEIGQLAMKNGWDSYIAYGRWANPSKSHLIKIGSMWDERLHGLQSRLFDNHGLASKKATMELVDSIKKVNPDLIHLHNVHGYYLNYPILFDFLSQYNKPVVWTLHDCWPITGHCAYFTYVQCDEWKTGCRNCKQIHTYPKSLFLCRSEKNYAKKKACFCSLDKMIIVPVSQWLAEITKESYLGKFPTRMIHNGVDLEKFCPHSCQRGNNLQGKKILLGVSSVWEKRKGLRDFFVLRELLNDNYAIIIVGLTKEQIDTLPNGIIGVPRTNSIDELRDYYCRADVFVNPTYEDNFPTTNIEALACGTPVITYDTGGSPEAIDEKTGIVVQYGNVTDLAEAVKKMCQLPSNENVSKACRQRAEFFFNKSDRYQEYIELYNQLLNQ